MTGTGPAVEAEGDAPRAPTARAPDAVRETRDHWLARTRAAAQAACAEAAARRGAAACVGAEARVLMDEVQATVRAARASHPERLTPPGRPIRVLVVDDLAAMRRLLVRQLTRAGHEVVGEAGSAAEALAQARACAPDVVLLDVHLPDGLGTDVAACLTAATPAAPGARGGNGRGHRHGRLPPAVVFCTGDAASAAAVGDGSGGAPWGACAVQKPASADELDGAVRAAAARRGLVARGPGVPPLAS